MDPDNTSFTSQDWSILPASVYVRPSVYWRWQYWRGHRAVQLPAPFLASDNLNFHCEPGSVDAFDDTAEIGSWYDWTNGVTEEFDDSLAYPHGWALEVAWDVVDKFLRESGGTFSWVCELKGFNQDHSYEPYSVCFQSQQTYGTTNLILPL